MSIQYFGNKFCFIKILANIDDLLQIKLIFVNRGGVILTFNFYLISFEKLKKVFFIYLETIFYTFEILL